MSEVLPVLAKPDESALYDLLRERFGIGDYDDSGDLPWFKARGTEIAKLKSTLRSRRVGIDDMLIAVWFAERERRPITATYQLCNITGEARKAYRVYLHEVETSALRQRLEAAAGEAHVAGHLDWAGRLYSADLSTGEQMLADWAKWCADWEATR